MPLSSPSGENVTRAVSSFPLGTSVPSVYLSHGFANLVFTNFRVKSSPSITYEKVALFRIPEFLLRGNVIASEVDWDHRLRAGTLESCP